MAYYYLIASLPLLRMDEAVPFTLDTFLATNFAQLDPDHARDLERLRDGDLAGCRHPFLQEWRDRETQLRNAVARARGAAGRGSAEKYLGEHAGFDVRTERVVAEAMAMDNPLQRELALDQQRWRLLDDMALTDPFGPGTLFAFAIKLRLAERWASLTVAEGEQTLNNLINSQIESVAEGNIR